ncbi:MAG: hypothetical protein GY713_05010 [Actinomycetia bacterium]|nr:hypothetical protein [Actinomycetes bacterium]
MTVETDDREVVAWGRQETSSSTGSGNNNSLAFFWFPNAQGERVQPVDG